MLIPIPVPRLVWIVVSALWLVLFACGVLKFSLEREWGYALVCLMFVIPLALGIVRAGRTMRQARSVESADSESEPSIPPPIE